MTNIVDRKMMMRVIENTVETHQSRIIDFPGRDEVEKRLKSVLMEGEGIIKDICLSLLESGGKRLRPMMVIYSGLCFSKLTPDMINTAAAAELIHMASLVHDDIIDKSDSRRGIATVNAEYGNHSAVLTGDYIFAKAFHILSSFKLLKSMEYLVEAIEEMCDGEVVQAADRFNESVTIEDYFRRIGKKTGILVSSCCRAGAAAGGASDEEISVMDQYGMNVGYAFQIVDDILDIVGDERRTGKPKGMDILQGNITLPFILLMKDDDYGPAMKSMIRTGKISNYDLEYINDLMSKTGIIKKSFEIAAKCIAKAKSSIYTIPDSSSRSILLSIADRAVNRDS